MRAPPAPLLVVLALAGCHPFDAPVGDDDPVSEAAEAPVGVTRLVFGVSSFTGEEIEAIAEPLRRYLQSSLGVPVALRVAEPYRELPALLDAGQVDVAQIAPLAYVRLRDAGRARAIATPIIGGSPTYLGHLYVRVESPYESLRELEGVRIGYVSADSTSGYLFPRALFDQHGIAPDTFFRETRFYRSHPAVVEAVLAGEIDVGAAFDMTSDWAGLQDARERPAGLRVLAKTARVPNDCFAARTGLDAGTVGALRRALLALRPGHARATEVLAGLRVNGWVPADERRYDRIRDVLAREASRRPR